MRSVRNVGSFLAGGALAQLIGAISGILLVRWMSIPDYAIYTVATTMAGAVFVLTKGGPHMGLSAVLSRVWPDRSEAAKAVASSFRTRLVISALTLPPLLGFSAYLFHSAGAGTWLVLLLVGLLGLIWLADMYSGIIDQVLFFDGRAVRVQAADTVIAAGRLALIVALRALGFLSVVAAVATSLFVVAVRIPPIRKWVGQSLGQARAASDPAMEATVKSIALRQMPVDIFTLLQSQAAIFYLTLETANAAELATFGALSRLAQIMTPFAALSLAYFLPAFSASSDRVLQRIGWYVLLGSLPAVALLALVLAAPQSILFLLGEAYEGQTYPLVVYAIVLVILIAVDVAWRLISHRGWNRWAWLRIPIGVAWIVAAPWFIPVDTAAGAYIFVAGFSVGTVVALAADLWHSRHRGEIKLVARGEPIELTTDALGGP
jgi:O-antigen/teichoic acid export membrane protein